MIYISLISGAIEQFISDFRRERAVRQKGEAFFKNISEALSGIVIVATVKGKPIPVKPIKKPKALNRLQNKK